MKRRKGAMVLALATVLSGCAGDPTALAVVPMRIGDQTFSIEVAATTEAQEKGLMKRDSMEADHGMIFVFTEEKQVGFWMKNTRIPLDILFLNSIGRVISIHQMSPYDLQTTYSDYPARYAIELNKGAADRSHVHVGDVLVIPPQARPRGN